MHQETCYHHVRISDFQIMDIIKNTWHSGILLTQILKIPEALTDLE